MPYNILLMGASYGSLLASKMLFGGHTIHLVCLPAEADLINAEGFRVRLPMKGRKDPVVLDSRKLPGKVTAGPATGLNPEGLRPGRSVHDGAAVSRAGRARIARLGGEVARAVHVDHEYAAASVRPAHPWPGSRRAEARLHGSDGVGEFRSAIASRSTVRTRRRSARRTSKSTC